MPAHIIISTVAKSSAREDPGALVNDRFGPYWPVIPEGFDTTAQIMTSAEPAQLQR